MSDLGLKTNPFEEFEHEGTRECYVGSSDRSARLLLLEAREDGPYRRALHKRGPGLHHIGVQVQNLESYANQLGSAGWLLHTQSLASIKKTQTAYFARPQTLYLVEAWEHAATAGMPSIELLEIGSADQDLEMRTNALGITNSTFQVRGESKDTVLTVEGRRFSISALI